MRSTTADPQFNLFSALSTRLNCSNHRRWKFAPKTNSWPDLFSFISALTAGFISSAGDRLDLLGTPGKMICRKIKTLDCWDEGDLRPETPPR